MSDLPFCAALWLLFLVVDASGAWSRARVVAVTVLGFALIGTRLAGVAIVPALGIYWLLHRRTLGIRPLVPVLVWGGAGLAALAAGAMSTLPTPSARRDSMRGAAGWVVHYRCCRRRALSIPETAQTSGITRCGAGDPRRAFSAAAIQP
jgi:hypothetical protein